MWQVFGLNVNLLGNVWRVFTEFYIEGVGNPMVGGRARGYPVVFALLRTIVRSPTIIMSRERSYMWSLRVPLR